MVTKLMRLSGVLGLASVAVAGLSPARADRGCAGNILGSLLQALPNPIIVSPDTPVSSAVNPDLARRFVVGLEGAGVKVVQQGHSNTNLGLTFSVMNAAVGGGTSNSR